LAFAFHARVIVLDAACAVVVQIALFARAVHRQQVASVLSMNAIGQDAVLCAFFALVETIRGEYSHLTP